MRSFPFHGLTRLLALPAMVRAQLSATLLNSAGTMVKLFLPLWFRANYELDFTTIGTLMAAYGAGSVAGAYLGGVLTSRIDPRRSTVACMFASGGLVVLLSQLPAAAWLFVIVPAAGAADGAFRPANLRLIMESGNSEQHTWLQGLHRVCYNLGAGLAGLAASQLADSGYQSLFLLVGLANLMGGSVLLCHAPCVDRAGASPSANVAAHKTREGSGSPWSDRPFLLFVLGQLLALGIFDQMYGTLSLFLAEDYHLDASWIGYLFAMNALLIVLIQVPAMRWIEQIGLVPAARWGVLLLAIAFPILNFGTAPGFAVTTMLLVTLAEILLTPAWTLAVLRRTIDRDRGKYLGIFTAAWLGHSLYGPAFGLWIYGALGGRNVWWACAVTGLVVWCFHYRSFAELSATDGQPASGAAASPSASS
ncbi:MFS transporter [Cupriavidus necator]